MRDRSDEHRESEADDHQSTKASPHVDDLDASDLGAGARSRESTQRSYRAARVEAEDYGRAAGQQRDHDDDYDADADTVASIKRDNARADAEGDAVLERLGHVGEVIRSGTPLEIADAIADQPSTLDAAMSQVRRVRGRGVALVAANALDHVMEDRGYEQEHHQHVE